MTPIAPGPDKTLAAAGLILIYASLIGFTDNYVKVIAAEAGLWQFHAVRSAMALVKRGGYRSVAFPLIGAGSGGGKAARVPGWIVDEPSRIEFPGEVRVVRFRKAA